MRLEGKAGNWAFVEMTDEELAKVLLTLDAFGILSAQAVMKGLEEGGQGSVEG